MDNLKRESKLEKLMELVHEINDLDVENLGQFCFGMGNAIKEVFFVGGPKNLPAGEIKYESRDDSEYNWRAVVVKDGIRYTALVDRDDEWALYV